MKASGHMKTSEQEIEEALERIGALALEGRFEELRALAEDLHPSDLAVLLESLDEDQQIALLSALPAELASETLAEMSEGEDRADLLSALTPEKSAELLSELANDDAADLIGELDPEEQQRILASLSEEDAGDIRELLEYGEETAGGLMTTEFVAVVSTLTAAEALAQVRTQGREVESFYTVFVVDAEGRLVGTLRLDDLVIADPADRIDRLVQDPEAVAHPELDQEDVGRLITRYNLASLPVVDDHGTLLGRITFDDVIDVIEAEQTEDILLMAGVGGDEEALRYTWIESVRARLPWLLVNMGTAALASSVVYLFSETIENAVILASLMPIVAGLGGNAGNQALAVTVRNIALEGGSGRRKPIGLVVGREMTVGFVNGAILGSVVAAVAAVVGGDPILGVVVLLAMWGNLVVAGFLGSFVPSVLDRLGVDPAVASAIFVSPFTDLCGFLFLLGLATQILL